MTLPLPPATCLAFSALLPGLISRHQGGPQKTARHGIWHFPCVPPGLLVPGLSETVRQAKCMSQAGAKVKESRLSFRTAQSCSRTYWVKDSSWPSGSVSEILQPRLMSVHKYIYMSIFIVYFYAYLCKYISLKMYIYSKALCCFLKCVENGQRTK